MLAAGWRHWVEACETRQRRCLCRRQRQRRPRPRPPSLSDANRHRGGARGSGHVGTWRTSGHLACMLRPCMYLTQVPRGRQNNEHAVTAASQAIPPPVAPVARLFSSPSCLSISSLQFAQKMQLLRPIHRSAIPFDSPQLRMFCRSASPRLEPCARPQRRQTTLRRPSGSMPTEAKLGGRPNHLVQAATGHPLEW